MCLSQDLIWAQKLHRSTPCGLAFFEDKQTANAARFCAACLGLMVLAGCNVGPRYEPPVAPTVVAYTPQPQPEQTTASPGSAGAAQRFEAAATIPARWWTLFHSPELNSMVQTALANSPTLEQASARIREAQEDLNARTGTSKFPNITANTTIAGEQPNLSAYGIPFPNPSPFALVRSRAAWIRCLSAASSVSLLTPPAL